MQRGQTRRYACDRTDLARAGRQTGVTLAGNGLLARTATEARVPLRLSTAAAWPRWTEVVHPAGVTCIIDVWRGHAPAERNFARFAGFVSALRRHQQLIPQLTTGWDISSIRC